MKTTTVTIEEETASRLDRIAETEGRSQADVLRDAILLYADRHPADREFALFGVAESADGRVADLPEEELLKGFGE